MEDRGRPSSSSPMARAVTRNKERRPVAVKHTMLPDEGSAKVSTVIEGIVPGRQRRHQTVYAQALRGHKMGSNIQCWVMVSSHWSRFW